MRTGEHMVTPWKKEAAQWYFAFLIVALFTFMIVALCAVLQDAKKGLASAEAASWMQAIGSVAAIFAVIWVSQAQDRQRRAEALTVAAVVASSMVHRITQVKQSFRTASEQFDTMSRIDGNPVEFAKILLLIDAQPNWHTDDVVRLAALPNQSAYKIAAAIDRTFTAKLLLEKAVADQDVFNDNKTRMDYAKKISIALDEAATFYEVAANNMHDFVKEFTTPCN